MIGDRLNALRTIAATTCSEIDVLAGLSDGYCSQIESGRKANPTIETLRAIAVVLGCAVGYLSNGEGHAPSNRKVRAAIARARKKLEKK